MAGTHVAAATAYGAKTETANTVITRLVEPRPNLVTRLRFVSYTAQGTAHTLTVMRPLNKTFFTAAAAAGQAVVNVQANPGSYAALAQGGVTVRTADNLAAGSDFVAYQAVDGTWVVDTIASVSSLAFTLTTNLPTGGVPLGGTLWWFGIITDTNPGNAEAHPQMALGASATTTFGSESDVFTGFLGSLATYPALGMSDRGVPILLHSGNATAAGTLNRVSAVYTTF